MMAAKLQHRHKLAADAAMDDIRSLTDSMSHSVLNEIIDKNINEAAQKYMKYVLVLLFFYFSCFLEEVLCLRCSYVCPSCIYNNIFHLQLNLFISNLVWFGSGCSLTCCGCGTRRFLNLRFWNYILAGIFLVE